MTAPSVGLAGQGLNFTVSEVYDVPFSDIPIKKQPSTENGNLSVACQRKAKRLRLETIPNEMNLKPHIL